MPNDPRDSASPELRDKRVAPAGVLPKNTQAWVLTGLASVMVSVIALSGRNTPKEKTPSATAAAASPLTADQNAAQIREYEARLKAESERVQIEKEQVALARQKLGLPVSGSISGQPTPQIFAPQGSQRYVTPPAREQAPPLLDGDRETKSLFSSNVALSYRAVPAQTNTPAPASAADIVARALSDYAPASPASANTVNAAVSQISPSIAKENPDESKAKQRAERDAKLNHSQGHEYQLFEGTVIETVLTNRLNGTFSGPVNCMVTTDVYSHNGEHVLIPEGSRILGEARKVETFGETRLAVFFHRLIMPDGYSVSLDKFQGLNQIGETGLQDQVNHHYLQVFGVSLALGAIAGFSQANTSYGIGASGVDAYRQGAASSLAQSSAHILDRFLNVLPTVTIREGHRVKVYLSDDLFLPAYEKHQMPSDL
jgi:type IV secretion system protein VirB10